MAVVALSNTSANLSGKTAVLAEVDQTITGLQTFDRGVGAPFAVNLGAAVVPNLIAANASHATNADMAADADKLDGLDGSAYTKPADLAIYGKQVWTEVSVAFPTAVALYNWDPGIVGNTIIYMSCGANADITGFNPAAARFTGQKIHVVMISTSGGSITFYHEHASSSVGSQLRLRPMTPLTGFWGVAEFQYSIYPGSGAGGWVLGVFGNGTVV